MKKIKKNKKNSTKRSVKILWGLVFAGILAVIFIFGGAYLGMFGRLPSLQQLENPEADLATEIYAADGTTLMGKIYLENRISVDYKDISQGVIDALISTEDERFYSHSGVDAKGTLRAIWGMGKDGGGSTITQQLAKNILGQGRGTPIKRLIDKIKEWIVAIKLEKNFTKQEIIALYLNRVSWLNIYGIRNASLVYFQKEPAQLSTDESALLIGMLKGPGAYNPITRPEAALARRNVVLDQMVRNDMLTTSQAQTAKARPLGIIYKPVTEASGLAPYFRAVLKKKLAEWCKTHKNPQTGEEYDLYRDGLKVYTTIDPVMQRYAEEAVIKHMTTIQKTFDKRLPKNVWKGHDDILNRAMLNSDRYRNMKEEGATDEEIKKSFNKPVKMKIFAWNKTRQTDTTLTPMDSIKYLKQIMQTGFVAMSPITGEIKAWVGGVDFKWFKYDHVTANRQVGSAFKPLVYTLAITDAGLNPESFIGGETITLGNKVFPGHGGTMAYCLARSINVAALDLIQRIGPKRTVSFAHEVGIESNVPAVPSIALGSADIKLIEMMQAYTMFPNDGYNVSPVMITRIEDKNGNTLQTFQSQTKQVISEVDAYTMYRMMQGVVDYGTAGSLRWRFGINSPIGGKTGTTNDNTDGWFIGYTPQLMAGAWVGCDDPFLKLTGEGSQMALPEFAYFMQKVYADKSLGIDPTATFDKPEQLDNNPIFADQNFAAIAREGRGVEQNENDSGNSSNDYNDINQVPLEQDLELPPSIKPSVNTPKPDGKQEKKDSVSSKQKDRISIELTESKTPKAVMPGKNKKRKNRNRGNN